MTALPSGTVTFLMTDIEGSTRLVAAVGQAFSALLDEHFALLDAAVGDNGGTAVSSEGDSLFAVFPSVRQGVAASLAGQRAITGHNWPDGIAPKVRMGIHTGEAVFGGRDYTGIDVHRTARIAGAAWGGQILVSEAARSLAADALPEGASFRDLGVHPLRDLPAPEHLFQLCGPGLVVEFPPPRTLARAPVTNLPAPLTRFVGRAREMAAIGALVTDERLVTLTGPGGTGKTRLAIETARSLVAKFPDGVWFVALDAVRDPNLVIPTIAQAIGVRDQPGRGIAAVLAESLATKRALLVLDNLEQVVDAAPDVASLLNAAPSVVVLASSREPLAVAGEHIYPVPPLGLPTEPGRPKAADLRGAESVDLFVERARAARADFELDDSNAPSVAAICRRLDGLPLAIELAAARANLLTPAQMLTRLDHRLTLLSSSRRDLPDRQRTLRGAIDWSYDLLDEPGRAMFRRFSVFAGGADLEALSEVIDPESELGVEILDVAAGLVDRSLLRSTSHGEENRLEMLETIHEYAAELLAGSGEEATLRARHAVHFRALVEPLGEFMVDPRRDEILDRLERELPNLRTVIAWSLETGNYETGFAILTALHDYWHVRDHLAEARHALERLLAASVAEGATAARAAGTAVAAELASWSFDHARAIELGERAVELADAAGDRRTLEYGYMSLGWAHIASEPETAVIKFDRAIEVARQLGDDRVVAISLGGKSVALISLGSLDLAAQATEQAIALAERIGDLYNVANANASLAMIDALRGNLDRAAQGFRAVVRGANEIGGHIMIAIGLDGLALVELGRRDFPSAARFAGAADGLRETIGGGATLAFVGHVPAAEQARQEMKAADFERAFAEGRSMTTDEAVEYALSAEGS